MPTDYYELLGVDRDSSEAQIKKAFRGLARELHPDRNAGDDAEERFKEVAAAYEVLCDPQRRAIYDRQGFEGLRSSGAAPDFGEMGGFGSIFEAFFGSGGMFGDDLRSDGPMRGADAGSIAHLTLADVVTGIEAEVSYDVIEACKRCDGVGAEPGSEVKTCGRCGGAGRMRAVQRTMIGTIQRTVACDECGGDGKLIKERCRECRGRSSLRTSRRLTVEVPPGVEHGQRVRITGAGHAGERGGPAGDLYVSVDIETDDRFIREGTELLTVIDVPVHEAALGERRTIDTLDGEREIEVPAGVQHGERITLKGHGLPSLRSSRRGDLHALVNLRVPRHLTDEQRRLLREFGDQLSDDQLDDDTGGLLHKLRRTFG